jgi:hypothetical protein
MSLQSDLDLLLVSESCEFKKALTPDQWYEFIDWCDDMFGEKNWSLEKGIMRFNGRCPKGSSTLFLLKWL